MSLIDTPDVIETILRHLKPWNRPERPPPTPPPRTLHYDVDIPPWDDPHRRSTGPGEGLDASCSPTPHDLAGAAEERVLSLRTPTRAEKRPLISGARSSAPAPLHSHSQTHTLSHPAAQTAQISQVTFRANLCYFPIGTGKRFPIRNHTILPNL